MICIVCKSEFLAEQIRSICTLHINERVKILPLSLLMPTLANEKVRTVLFDSNLFTDTAVFRKKSPDTKFIAVSSIGSETLAEKALICGASDFLLCPFTEKGVIRCL